MYKSIIILLIFVTISLIGFSYGQKFKKRYAELKECNKWIILLKNEILFNNSPLPEALMRISYKMLFPYDKLLKNMVDILIAGNIDTPYDAFILAMGPLENEMYLTDDDLNIIKELTMCLGDTGIYGQEKIITLALNSMTENLKDAKDICKKNTKLYGYLGVCIGAIDRKSTRLNSSH